MCTVCGINGVDSDSLGQIGLEMVENLKQTLVLFYRSIAPLTAETGLGWLDRRAGLFAWMSCGPLWAVLDFEQRTSPTTV